jgi:5-methylcytosine-specific restriction protein B
MIKSELLTEDPKICWFAFKCITYFSGQPIWKNIDSYVDDFSIGDSIKVGDKLTGMFKYETEDKIIALNTPRRRWYAEPFIVKGKEVYLSTEWYPGGNGRSLEIENLRVFIKTCFGQEYDVVKNESENKWELWKYSNVENNRIPLAETSDDKSSIPSIPFSVSKMISLISDTGLLYSPDLIKRFAFAMMSKPFVILSGLAGSGKTQLALAFASALIENDSQMCVVPVGADWTNREPLLGFPNALQQDNYIRPESGVLDLLIEANKAENANKPYFLILDEMNMSYVERYFADFLSAMESHKEIPLWNGNDGGVTPRSIRLPENLIIVGTINVDETTYMFSPKVLDRANVIEFKISGDEMKSFLKEKKPVDRDSISNKGAGMGADFVNCIKDKSLADDSKIEDVLNLFFDGLKEVNAEFGYRSATEIYRFISQALKHDDTEKKMDLNKAIDCAVVQKLMPKLHGSRKKLEGTLNALWKNCFEDEQLKQTTTILKDNIEKAQLPLTADKIYRMYNAALSNGFTSFSEA